MVYRLVFCLLDSSRPSRVKPEGLWFTLRVSFSYDVSLRRCGALSVEFTGVFLLSTAASFISPLELAPTRLLDSARPFDMLYPFIASLGMVVSCTRRQPEGTGKGSFRILGGRGERESVSRTRASRFAE